MPALAQDVFVGVEATWLDVVVIGKGVLIAVVSIFVAVSVAAESVAVVEVVTVVVAAEVVLVAVVVELTLTGSPSLTPADLQSSKVFMLQ